MWLIDLILGWKFVESSKSLEEIKKIKKGTIKLIEKKGEKIFSSVAGNQWKKGNRYYNPRGYRLAKSTPCFKFHIKGNSFIYRVYYPRMVCADVGGNGHYGYIPKNKYIIMKKGK